MYSGLFLFLYFLIGFTIATYFVLTKKLLSGRQFVYVTTMWFMYTFDALFYVLFSVSSLLSRLASGYIKLLKKFQGTNEKKWCLSCSSSLRVSRKWTYNSTLFRWRRSWSTIRTFIYDRISIKYESQFL